jgi:hypothetical protein
MVSNMQSPEEEPEFTNGNGLAAKATEKAREIGVTAKERASERVRIISHKARDTASEQLEHQRERVASGIDSAAGSLIEHAEQANRLQREAEVRMAHSMEAAAGYLHNHPSEEVARDMREIVRRRPMISVLVALLAGYLLARLLS